METSPTISTETTQDQGGHALPMTDTAPVTADRRGDDRRAEGRRHCDNDRRSGLDRRRGPGRRRSDDRRMAEEGEMNEEQFSFIMAINEYKQVNNRPFPSWTEVLDVVKAIGYRKIAEPGHIQ